MFAHAVTIVQSSCKQRNLTVYCMLLWQVVYCGIVVLCIVVLCIVVLCIVGIDICAHIQ